jgi:hypothetical protein
MWLVTKKAALLATGVVAFAGGTARASEVDVVKVPFAFVVQGHSFPAGEYRVERDAENSPVVLIRGEKGSRASMFVMTMPAEGRAPSGSEPMLTFDKREHQYELTDIWESGQGREVLTRGQSAPR